MKNWFRKVALKKEEKPEEDSGNFERTIKELLRENLATLAVDIFYVDDPLITLAPSDRKIYLKHFYDLSRDEKFIGRIKYLINKQARFTLEDGKDGKSSVAGAMNVNGMSVIKDDVERLAAMYSKENTPDEGFDKHSIV